MMTFLIAFVASVAWLAVCHYAHRQATTNIKTRSRFVGMRLERWA
jgi:hypothetical protein